MKNILIIGATSTIAESVAKLWAAEGNAFYLVARCEERLTKIATDLKVRGAGQIKTNILDLNDFSKHLPLIEDVYAHLGNIDIALIAHGILGDQRQGELHFEDALKTINTNALSIISLLTNLSNCMIERRHGHIAVIGSVAGDRGRISNYIYGASKAMLEAFCSGLRARLCKHQVNLLFIKPGFVATAMTAHLTLPSYLVASAECVAKDIYSAVAKKKDHIYTPWFWAGIMFLVRRIPTKFFKKISI